MGHYIIAHDLGTSGNKATLFTIDGKLVTSCTIPYAVHFFGKNCAEQNPNDWWKAVCEATKTVMREITPTEVVAISFSAQMQGCLLVDKEGLPLRPSLIWADQRAIKQTKHLEREIGFDKMYEMTGHRLSPSYTLEKLMWLKENESEVYQKAYKSLQAKDYILFRLTGRFVTDYSDASGTQALDLEKLQWSDEILEAAGIKKELLPELHSATDIIGKITRAAALETGLCEGTPVVCGGGDGPCAAVGAGCIQENQLFATFGTSAWIGGTTTQKCLDEDKIFFCFAHVIPGHYMPCGTMQAAGSAYAYIRKVMGKNKSYAELNEKIVSSPAGAKGLIFLPYMLGERSPRWNEQTSGAFLGIKMHHEEEDYIRAVIEGVGYNLELILKAYRKYLSVNTLILTGGGAKGDIICQILSDIFNAKLQTPNYVEEATSIAAAMIAGVGVGVYKDFEEVTRFLQLNKEYLPHSENQKVYEKSKKIFDTGYEALKPLFEMFE
ncbi:xylulokinase [Sporanaerobium hydrogeniformans]|uniref:Xylulokinase n=1 Tax=Sporanaerobium hydrogeniformans TaxID=3072179 RepID=A0AC61DG32_9FIRM|nr:xylulokinase [Sporanaerobium hydrogeniformans]PHV71402.1 xylulokinase [Sporanaerobium hydrogeniformans]